MQITLIRHLPTEWNKATWLQGRKDIELSPITDEILTEINQNQILLEKLLPFDIILASTLKRTHQTASLYGFKPESDELLDELDFGPFEGKPREKLLEIYGDAWFDNPKELVLGESLSNFEARIATFIKKYKKYQNLLVFGHGSWIRAIVSLNKYGHINNMNKMTVRNNECITLQIESKWMS